jgi:uncharacterized protein (DUF302 family)
LNHDDARATVAREIARAGAAIALEFDHFAHVECSSVC